MWSPQRTQSKMCADVRTQVAKLLIIPFVCMVERCWLGRTFTRPVILSMLVVVGGVAIVYDPIYLHGNLWPLCTECMSFFRPPFISL